MARKRISTGIISLGQAHDIATRRELVHRNELIPLVECAVSVLESEQEAYRPYEPVLGTPGGLLDFRGTPPVPTIVVPDLHARAGFFCGILSFRPSVPGSRADGKTPVLDLMSAGEARVVCVGDGLHSELHKPRWLEAYSDFEAGKFSGDAMRQEMQEGLSLMELVMRCKCAFPEFFHFLKGNHENILNSSRRGNHSFRKFVQEGEMVRVFMSEHYGDDALRLYASMEDVLPLCALCPNCIVSHAEPAVAFSRERLVDGLNDYGVVEGLTWTGNDESEDGCVEEMLRNLLPEYPEAVYFGGHRPVSGLYELRQGGRFVQIHNPRQRNVAVVSPFRPFDADNDIVSV